MSDFFDETLEEQESREKFEYFFGQYSSEVRKKLLSKNIPKPDNLYDILYTKVRQDLLAKNETQFSVDIDETAKVVRNNLLSKHVENQINLDLSGDNYRQTQLSRNVLLKSTLDLNDVSDSVRQNLISKNIPISIDLDKRASDVREKNLANNSEKDINLDQNSLQVRENLLSKNTDSTIDLDASASGVRERLLSSNVDNTINLDSSADNTRNILLSKNTNNEVNLDKQAAQNRDAQISKNTESEINLDSIADNIRNNILSKNKELNTNIDDIANIAREKNKSQNVENLKNLDETANVSRLQQIASNKESDINIDAIADNARKTQSSKNPEDVVNLDKLSTPTRRDMLSTNVSSEINLDDSAEKTRNNLLSTNKEVDSKIESIAESARNTELSFNVDTSVDLDNAAQTPRNTLLASNVQNNIDLDNAAQIPRNTLLAANTPIDINLDNAAQTPRNTLLAANTPINIDLDNAAQNPRNNLLAANTPINIDLDNAAQTPRNTLLASNVPNNIDLDNAAQTPRNTLLAANSSANIDLDVNSAPTRASLLATNNPKNIDLDSDSVIIRNNLLAANTSTNVNLDLTASITRNNLLAHNSVTSVDLDITANPIRNTLLAANVKTANPIESVANVFRHNLLSKNDKANGLGTNVFLAGTSTFIGVSNLEIISAPIRGLMKLRGKFFDNNTNLPAQYGLALSSSDGITPTAKITNAIQLYNLQKNAFMSVRYADKSSGYNTLISHNTDGFQQMLSLLGRISSKREIETNTTPANVVVQNQGVYVGLPTTESNSSPVTKLLKPLDGNLGTAASMMSNTVPSDRVAANFNKNERGVSRIINTIRKDSSIAMAKNYDSQNSTSFIIGTNSDGSNKLAYNRYTIANPYQPNKDAGTLELRIKNYAIYNGNKRLVHTMSFPPYVKSFANSDSANWNKIDYLGRPEPIYTYSNSSREGSLSFYVLTDYSQEVDIGYDYANQTAKKETFNKHFTDQINKTEKSSDIEVEISDKQNQLASYYDMLSGVEGQDVGDLAGIQSRINELTQEISNLEAKQKEITTGKGLGPTRAYKEFDTLNGNVYKTLINNGTIQDTSGNIELRTEETAQRLSRMKKDLLFQPGFFSGDKVDFLNRMEFIAKLTRPARSSSSAGFSFTFPPVCHIQLGDWFNHDVIINSVSYDYSDAPWTIDGAKGRTQPMWTLVSLSFNVVGTYDSQPGQNVPLATDIGGFYQKTIKSTGAPIAPSKQK